MSTTLQQPTTAPHTGAMPFANPLWTEQAALLVQGGYFVLTGLWPLFGMDSFLAVTGPKTDLWLVRTVGVLVAVIGGALLLAARREHPPVEIVALAIGASLGLALVDLTIVFTRAASPVYLLDAAIQAGLILWWVGLLKPATPSVVQFPAHGAPPRV
jgi:hypothetical protein